ncbi:MAG: hypothetical protein U1E76_14285 [Planctomycetota bacterium]
MRQEGDVPAEVRKITSLSALLGHLMWSGLGPALLIGLSIGIVMRGSGWLTPLDFAFIAVALVMIASRFLEHRSGQATTLAGQPATRQQLHRYLLAAPPILIGIWVAANVLGNHVLH